MRKKLIETLDLRQKDSANDPFLPTKTTLETKTTTESKDVTEEPIETDFLEEPQSHTRGT